MELGRTHRLDADRGKIGKRHCDMNNKLSESLDANRLMTHVFAKPVGV